MGSSAREGNFIEPKELTSVPNLPPWIRPGKPTPNMPQIVVYLLKTGYRNSTETQEAVSHLFRYWQNPDGSFKEKYMVWCMIEVLKRIGKTGDSLNARVFNHSSPTRYFPVLDLM